MDLTSARMVNLLSCLPMRLNQITVIRERKQILSASRWRNSSLSMNGEGSRNSVEPLLVIAPTPVLFFLEVKGVLPVVRYPLYFSLESSLRSGRYLHNSNTLNVRRCLGL